MHINSTDPCILFTVEDTRADGSIPFLDILVMPEPDKSLSKAVYREPIYTDLYLHL